MTKRVIKKTPRQISAVPIEIYRTKSIANHKIWFVVFRSMTTQERVS